MKLESVLQIDERPDSRVRVGALHLRHLDVPRPGEGGAAEGEVEGRGVAAVRANVHVHCEREQKVLKVHTCQNGF